MKIGMGMVRIIGMISIAVLSSVIYAADNGKETSSESEAINFPDFSSLRAELLSKIGGATKRVFLCTDFLTDADIVSSLYIAQYRKVDIKVLLGRDNASNIMSRLNYLQQVNIQTSLRPREFHPSLNTMVLIDDRLLTINVNLDYMTKAKNLLITTRPGTDIASLEAAFHQAMSGQVAPQPKPLPKVGRPHPSTKKPIAAEPRGTPISTGSVPDTAPEQSPTADPVGKRLESPTQQAAYHY